MTYEVRWLVEDRILLAEYAAHQQEETLAACLDEMLAEFDSCLTPFVMLVDWSCVTGCDLNALLNMRGHYVYSHPLAMRWVVVGMDASARYEHEIATGAMMNIQYCDTLEEAMAYLDNMLTMDVEVAYSLSS